MDAGCFYILRAQGSSNATLLHGCHPPTRQPLAHFRIAFSPALVPWNYALHNRDHAGCIKLTRSY